MAKTTTAPKKRGTATFAVTTPTLRGVRPPWDQEIATRASQADWAWFGGMLPNPDPVLRKAGKSIEVYRELLTDPHVGAAVFRRKGATKGLKWFVNKEGADETASDVIEKWLAGMPLRRIVSQMLDAILYGYQPMEILWEQQGLYWLPRAIVAKPREWFDFNDQSQLRFRPRTGDPIVVPMEQFLLPTYEASYENPYGDPLLSRCFWPVTFKRGGLKFWVRFTEKYGMPWPVFSYPDGMDPADIDKLVASVDMMVQDAVMALPDTSKGELINGASTASVEIYKGLCEYLDDQMSKVLVGHTGALDAVSGSLGGQDQGQISTDALLGDDVAMVEEQLNRLKELICDLNFPPGIIRPTIEAYKKEDVDKAKADRDAVLKGMGVKFKKVYISTTYGIPEEEFDMDGEPAADPTTSVTDPAAAGGGANGGL